MRDFIDEYRDFRGVEPISKVLQIAPSGYRQHAAFRREPQRRCARVQRDQVLAPQKTACGEPTYRSAEPTRSGGN